MAKKRENSGGVSNDLIQGAIQEGIGAIIEAHPRFKGQEEYIAGHIDQRALKKGIKEISDYIAEHGGQLSDEQKAEALYNNLASYVASGKVFDESAKKVVLRSGLEEKARGNSLFGRARAGRDVEGEKYIDQATEAFRDVYTLMKHGDYAARMPELAESVGSLYDLGFLDTAIDVLAERGLVDERSYGTIKKSLKERRKEETYKFQEALHKYSAPREVAASVLMIFGVVLLIGSFVGITGNAISLGELSERTINWTSGILGLVLVVGGILLGMSERGMRRSVEDSVDGSGLASRDKTDVLKQLRRDLNDFDGEYSEAVELIQATLAVILPKSGLYGRDTLRREQNDLNQLARVLSEKYGDISKQDAYRDIAGEDMHRTKGKYGRRGR